MSDIHDSDAEISTNEASLLEAMTQPLPDKDYKVNVGTPLAQGAPIASKESIISALQTVSDPEIMINIWDMGLIYDIRILNNGNVEIDMTVTAPTCPVAGVLPAQAAEAVSALDGVGEVEVRLVWEPAWTFERLSDEAKMMFEMF